MISDYDAEAIRGEEGRPVGVGGADLAQATRVATTAGGFWGLFALGDDAVVVHPGGAMRGRPDAVAERLAAFAADGGRPADERDVAASLLAFLGGDDPGRAPEGRRSRVEAGVPPTYPLGDERNAPPAPEPPSPPETGRRPGAGGAG